MFYSYYSSYARIGATVSNTLLYSITAPSHYAMGAAAREARPITYRLNELELLLMYFYTSFRAP